MHEILNISVSQRSNHLTTQFFNCQEALLYSSDGNINDNSVFLKPTIDRLSKTVSYSPRALLWDAKTGNGSLGTHQYAETKDYYEFEGNASHPGNSIMMTHPRIEKSEYQRALDSGTQLPLLNSSNTKYWSDYSRLIYPPSSFNSLTDWYHDVDNPNTPDYENLGQRKFDNYNIGFNEFNENYCMAFFDDNLHQQLEQSDSLQGFNLIADMDNGWGGFSTALLQELKNELPKSTVFTWGFNEDDPLTASTVRDQRITRMNLPFITNKLKASINLLQESDLLFPIYSSPIMTNWEVSGMVCKVFDSVNSVFSQNNLEQRKSMNHFVNYITNGDDSKNIVSNIIDEENPKLKYSFYPRVIPFKNKREEVYEFSHCTITRCMDRDDPKSRTDKTDINEIKTYSYFPADTIPEQFSKSKDFKLRLSSTEACRDVYKHWHEIVSKYFKNDPDREELKEQLSSVASSYEFGWYDDDDSGDDDH